MMQHNLIVKTFLKTISDNALKDGGCEIARNCNYDGYQRALASMVYKFFDEKTRTGISVNEQLAEELHETVIKIFKRRKVYARFKDNIWTVDLVEIELLSSMCKSAKYLLCVIDLFTKYARFRPLKDKKI